MRCPVRKMLMWLAIAAAGLVAIIVAFQPAHQIDENWSTLILAIVGATMLPFGAVYAVWAFFLWRGQARLRAGYRLLANWHCSPDDWRRFSSFESVRAQAAPGLGSDYRPANQDSDRGIDVRIGETGISIGDFYQTLRRGGVPALHALYWLPPPADPQCLEFHLIYPRRFGGGSRLCVRVPIAREPAADAAARRVYAYFEPLLQPKPALALRNPAKTINIALAVTAVCAASLIWGLWRAGQGDGTEIAPLIAVVVGAITGVTALLMALFTVILSRRKT